MRALISAPDLLDLVTHGADLVLVDVQWNLTTAGGPPGRELYAAAHLPGAHHVDLDAELAGPPGPSGRHPLPTARSVEAALRRCGAGNDSPIVVYDQGRSFGAARAWWVLRHFGARDVRVLDGGLAGWTAAGGETTAVTTPAGNGSFEAHAGGMPLLDAAGAEAVTRDGVLLDARAPERYRGETEPVDPVAGHIPGALNAPASDSVGADGTLLPADALRELFSRKGVRPGVPVGSYCGSGVTAAHQVLALYEAGVKAALYIGSWSDWIGDPDHPVATGVEA